jgi:DNA-binding GntR family transcriptional regulator
MSLVTTAPIDLGDGSVSASLAGRLYATVRRRIILGEFPQGSRLPEQRLADELEVSRIPLREALSRLHTDGLIETRPRRSAVVTSWATSTVHDLFDARLALETSAAARAAARVAGVPQLQEALERSTTELQSGDDLGFAEANVRFHQALVAAAGNPLLDGLMRTVSARMVWLFYLTSHRDHGVACREHSAIVAAIQQGNPRLAETLVYAHIEVGREPTLATMRTILRE